MAEPITKRARDGAKREPLVTRATIVAIAAAIVGVLVAFGVPLDDTQQSAVLGFVGVLAPLAAAAWARRKVSPSGPA